MVVDVTLVIQWVWKDETNRKYSLDVLASLSRKRALVRTLWHCEICNGLVMAYRRKRITLAKVEGFLTRLKALPIDTAHERLADLFEVPDWLFCRI